MGRAFELKKIYYEQNCTTPTAKSYIQDGLIAMWDGIENAGYGEHSNNPDEWTDLIGGKNLTLLKNANYSWDANCMKLLGTGQAGYCEGRITEKEPTTEIVVANHAKKAGIILCYGISATDYLYTDTAGYVAVGRRDYAAYLYNSTASLSRSDGALFFNGESIAPTRANDYWNFNPTSLGSRNWDGVTDTISAQCDIYCIRLYNRALTADEIASNFAIDKARFNIPDATA